ncbi:uncharacterized protein HKW66_Vig0176860 [Vigna angularis]|uniref:Uncharacterized protein n=1 Tax=Phaseolus angularis TaxID=3914 RepID=A0A8T0JQE0_PHAAN|nr:uncharacterized protein HKW66_Vig0176860 [Vigna angularis]
MALAPIDDCIVQASSDYLLDVLTGVMIQEEMSLALLNKAAAQRMEAMKAMKAKPMNKERPATKKSNRLNPTIIRIAMLPLRSE